MSKTDFRVGWVERRTGRSLTEFQAAAVCLLCDAMRCGPYDFPTVFDRAQWDYGQGVSFVVRGDFSSYDTDGLTTLVLGAHDRAIRVEVSGHRTGPGHLRITMHPRSRDGTQGARHPTVESMLAARRRLYPHHHCREVPVEYLRDVDELLTVLTKNAPHCFGIDFGVLNRTLINTSTTLGNGPRGNGPAHWLTEKD